MAPMASMLARAASSASAACRASRAAALASARAARSAAAARRAAAAVSRAARSSTEATTAADLALGTTTSDPAKRVRYDYDETSRTATADFFSDDKAQTAVVEFVADEKDLQSDGALWASYERWCKHFNQERDRDEMARRFDEFKKMVLYVHQANKSDRPYKLEINQFTDGKLSELYGLGRHNAFKQEEFAAKLPKTGVRYIWLNDRYYMELPEEFQPE